MELLKIHELAFLFGLSGNIISFMVFLSPMPTFYKIYEKKSSKGFQSIPYIVALASATLLLYYGILKTHAFLIITINTFGCIIEIAYLVVYVIYAPKEARIFTLKMIVFCNIGALALLIVVVDLLLAKPKRVTAVGWVCAAYSLAVFAAPLSIMRKVIRTKSVEYMPFLLSFFLTLNAVMWFFYGLLIKDKFIATPNILGFIFGVAQMILYMMYKNANVDANEKTPENAQQDKETEPNIIIEINGNDSAGGQGRRRPRCSIDLETED